MPETRIDLLRHGQCEGGEIFRGSTDVLLTESGWSDMRGQLDLRSPAPWHRIVSSPLHRCQRFAEETAERLKLPLIIEPDLREMHFGDWEGQDIARLRDEDPLLARWGEDPETHSPPNGEPLSSFAERVSRALDRLAREHPGESLLVVTHGGVIRYLLTRAKGLERNRLREMFVPYAHYVQLSWYEQRLTLIEDINGAL